MIKPYSNLSAPGVFAARPSLSAADFPFNGPSSAKLEFLLRYAVLAPSGRNTQPWRFVVSGSTMEIFADFRRTLGVVDPQNRELIMSCGAVLLTLRVAIRNFGLTATTEICPEPDRPELLARLELRGRAPSGRTDHKLFKAILDRRTNRQPFERRSIPRALLYRWERAAAYEEASVIWVADPDLRAKVAGLVAEGERSLGASPDYRGEISRWLRSNDSTNRDGLPGYSLGLGALSSRVAPSAVFPFGDTQARRNRELILGAASFGVLGTDDDTLEAWMMAGQALARLLLSAQSEGVSASFFLQPIELPELRARLVDLLGGEMQYPQITFRLGYGPRVPPTPRRPLSEVLTVVPGEDHFEDEQIPNIEMEEAPL